MKTLDAKIIACGGESDRRSEVDAFMHGVVFVCAQFLAAADVVRKNEKGNPKFAVNLCKLAEEIYEAAEERARELYPPLPGPVRNALPSRILQD